jgi:hypothetical protein
MVLREMTLESGLRLTNGARITKMIVEGYPYVTGGNPGSHCMPGINPIAWRIP